MTHTKRLTSDEQFTEKLQEFLASLVPLGPKLAAILVQLPPSMRVDNARLQYLAEQVRDAEQLHGVRFPLTLEFRNETWFNDATFELLRQYNIATVMNDSPNRWPATRAITADWAYIRFHGSTQLYRSSYSDDELAAWAEFMRTACADCKQIFCYFNNDFGGVALGNAKSLQYIVDTSN